MRANGGVSFLPLFLQTYKEKIRKGNGKQMKMGLGEWRGVGE
jgi:hypothetical protein